MTQTQRADLRAIIEDKLIAAPDLMTLNDVHLLALIKECDRLEARLTDLDAAYKRYRKAVDANTEPKITRGYFEPTE